MAFTSLPLAAIMSDRHYAPHFTEEEKGSESYVSQLKVAQLVKHRFTA